MYAEIRIQYICFTSVLPGKQRNISFSILRKRELSQMNDYEIIRKNSCSDQRQETDVNAIILVHTGDVHGHMHVCSFNYSGNSDYRFLLPSGDKNHPDKKHKRDIPYHVYRVHNRGVSVVHLRDISAQYRYYLFESYHIYFRKHHSHYENTLQIDHTLTRIISFRHPRYSVP